MNTSIVMTWTVECHLNKGRPTYVVVWKIKDKAIQVVEVKYAGTHENADYGRLG